MLSINQKLNPDWSTSEMFPGVLTEVLYGEAPPKFQPLIPFYILYYFWQKINGKMYFFHKHGLDLFFPFDCCKCTVFKIWINHKTLFFTLFHTPYIYFNKWNPYPFIYLNPENGTSFGQTLSVNI